LTGVFCEIYGNGIRNRVIQFFLENQFGDFAISSLAMQLKISRPKAYEYVGKFEKLGYISKSRVIGRTQLYKLNKTHKHVKILLKTFMSCLDLVAEEYSTKKNQTSSHSSVGAVSAKNA
jgi:hypothetical protein